MSKRATLRRSLLLSISFFCGLAAANATAAVVTLQAVSESPDQSQQDVPMTFGQIFKDGAVPAGTWLTATIDGQSIPVQVDRKATHADGTLRHAVVTVVVPTLSASATRLITLSAGGTRPADPPVSLDDLLASNFDAQVSLTVNGQLLTADARSLLEQARADGSCRPWGKECNVWLSGPQVSEWIVSAPLKSATGSSPHLAARFYVRAYAGDPIHRVRVNVVIENDWTWVADPQNVTYDATLTVGDNTYSKQDITHYAHTRWHRVMWWGDKAEVYAKLDGQYLQASKAISHYADVHPGDAFLDKVRQSVEPMDNGDETDHMTATGAQAAIGPLPRWTTAYVLSMDRRAFLWMLANDDGAGSYNVYYRDKNTGRPVTITDYPYMTLLGTYNSTYNPDTGKYESFPPCSDCANPYVANAAHEPSIGYVSYMVTGDFYYLEQLQFWADWNEFQINPNYRSHSTGLLWSNQVRAQAWALRTLGDVTYITPDDDPLKSYFVTILRANMDWYNQDYTNNANANKLGAITDRPYAVHYHDHTSLAPWQDDFFTWAIGHLADLGVPGAEAFSRWKSRFVVERMTNPGYCWLLASAYTLMVRDGKDYPFYTSVAESYEKQYPVLSQYTCNSPEMLAAWGGHQPGEMYGYATSPTGYPSNLQPALAAAVDAGAANADLAWQKFADRPVKPDYTNYANFAIVPRPPGSDTAPPALQPSIGFYAEPNPVVPGASTTLHWNASGVTSCSAPWMTGNAISGEQTVGPINGAEEYGITCKGTAGSATASITVIDDTVKRPEIELQAQPATVQEGQATVVSWEVQGADHCYALGDWGGDLSMAGQRTIGPLESDASFEIKCESAVGEADKTVSVHVQSVDEPHQATATDDTAGAAKSGGGGAFGLLAYFLLFGTALAARCRLRRPR
ncbi:MAG TPA: hypothetical protein VFH85_01895 [Gammaproteobacteria bacterium]|nr:hypothetical protein [Gammaproteobacteria bacterium]